MEVMEQEIQRRKSIPMNKKVTLFQSKKKKTLPTQIKEENKEDDFFDDERQDSPRKESDSRPLYPEEEQNRITSTDNEETKKESTSQNPDCESNEVDYRYSTGYISWIWARHGFFSMFARVFAWPLFKTVVMGVFGGCGYAIGAYFFQKHFTNPMGLKKYN